MPSSEKLLAAAPRANPARDGKRLPFGPGGMAPPAESPVARAGLGHGHVSGATQPGERRRSHRPSCPPASSPGPPSPGRPLCAPPGGGGATPAPPLPALRAGLHGGGGCGSGDCGEAGGRQTGAGGGAVGPGRVSSAAQPSMSLGRPVSAAGRPARRGGQGGLQPPYAWARPRRTKALCSFPPGGGGAP